VGSAEGGTRSYVTARSDVGGVYCVAASPGQSSLSGKKSAFTLVLRLILVVSRGLETRGDARVFLFFSLSSFFFERFFERDNFLLFRPLRDHSGCPLESGCRRRNCGLICFQAREVVCFWSKLSKIARVQICGHPFDVQTSNSKSMCVRMFCNLTIDAGIIPER
jgi:hypothetical protein